MAESQEFLGAWDLVLTAALCRYRRICPRDLRSDDVILQLIAEEAVLRGVMTIEDGRYAAPEFVDVPEEMLLELGSRMAYSVI